MRAKQTKLNNCCAILRAKSEQMKTAINKRRIQEILPIASVQFILYLLLIWILQPLSHLSPTSTANTWMFSKLSESYHSYRKISTWLWWLMTVFFFFLFCSRNINTCFLFTQSKKLHQILRMKAAFDKSHYFRITDIFWCLFQCHVTYAICM